jgi:hypothetical protein
VRTPQPFSELTAQARPLYRRSTCFKIDIAG